MFQEECVSDASWAAGNSYDIPVHRSSERQETRGYTTPVELLRFFIAHDKKSARRSVDAIPLYG